MNQIELIDKRKPREKHFLQKDGTIRAEIYNTDIHFLKNGKYEEIDNTLVKENDSYVNKSNDYKVEFKDDIKKSLMKMSKDNHYIDFKLKENKKSLFKVGIRKLSANNITSGNIADNIKVEYQALSNKVKETIVLQDSNYEELSFNLDTNLNLELVEKEVSAKDENGNAVFKIEKPFMFDSNNIRNDNIYYLIGKTDNGYELKLMLDDEWLKSQDRQYPVYIDPTITNTPNAHLQDTYIYPNDTNDTRNNQPFLKAGVEMLYDTKVPNRTLIKFDLPVIGTGSKIIDAKLDLVRYPTYTENPKEHCAVIHRITADWNETTANWNNMHDKFDERVEGMILGKRNTISHLTADPYDDGNITNLVKKWYKDIPNYGIMIKAVDENEYIDNDIPIFYSKENGQTGDYNPRPIIRITYKNHNGLENYLAYQRQSFSDGMAYVNMYNGNLTVIYNIGQTIGGSMPINLNLVYNTNDKVLEKINSFGLGYKLSLDQSIYETLIDNNECLEYEDEDGTLHYFYKDNSDNNYYDSEGLNLKIEKDDLKCIMTDSASNKMTFIMRSSSNYYGYHLERIEDSDGNFIKITFNGDDSIELIEDNFGNKIYVTYRKNYIGLDYGNRQSWLNYSKGLLTSITTKNGTTLFSYNDNSLIESITDVTGLKIEYQYYDNLPYKIKKVQQIGLNDSEGESYSLDYDYCSTILKDYKGRQEIFMFNEYGNLISTHSMDGDENIDDAYSTSQTYGSSGKEINKILSASIPTKFVKNYLKNSSFEKDDDLFATDSENLILSYATDEYNSGKRSLKAICKHAGQSLGKIISVPKGKSYTFSGYFKVSESIIISLSYNDSEYGIVYVEEKVDFSDKFERNDVTINYKETATSDLMINISFQSVGVAYIDDVQLEIGETANNYNVIENPDFSNGYSDWDLSAWNYNDYKNENVNENNFFSLVHFNNNKSTALKIHTDPRYGVRFKKAFPIKGKAGDLYTISFWYKNEGIPLFSPLSCSYVQIFYKKIGNDNEYCTLKSEPFNPNEKKWQYFSYRNVAPEDFEEIYIIFTIDRQANDIYFTNLSLYKNVTSGDYKYDEHGNLISSSDQLNNKSIFKYNKNNKLISSTTTLGKSLNYEYDKKNINRVINAISSDGFSNKVIYDNKGNPITTRIARKNSKNISNSICKIRNAGTNNFIKAELNMVLLEQNECSNTVWTLEENGEYYKIIYTLHPQYSISCKNGIIKLSKENANNLFTLKRNENGSYHIIVTEESQNGKVTKLLKAKEDSTLELTSAEEDLNTEFYIESVEKLFIENNAEYTEDGRFVKKVITSDLAEIEYDIDLTNGLVKSLTNPAGNIITYGYNQKEQLTSITMGDKTINYDYNDKNLLSKISIGNRDVSFIYDDFLNDKKIKIGDSTYVNNEYEEKNGNRISTTFGNNQAISYEYDGFNRIIATNKMDDIYRYKYNNNGKITKILSNNHTEKCDYDISNRLYKYRNNNFVIDYTYNSEDSVTKQSYKLINYTKNNDLVNTVENIYDSDESLIKSKFNDDDVNYEYDDLGRISNIELPNGHKTIYEYISNGKRATNNIRKFITDNNKYEFEYDKLNNITKVFYNNNLINNYYYDMYSELIKEENYEARQVIEYSYDNYGNLITKIIKNLDTDEIIDNITYHYNSKDQLTNYNNKVIEYDEIGNPISIGNNITLNWINGRELKSYVNNSENLIVNYKYNVSGIRTSKVVNGIETNYILEGNNIIYEKWLNNIIYYLYDYTGLIGLMYNGKTYYYVKNLQNDIIGILNSQNEQIVTYKYDSWGKLLSVKDIQGNDITDKNNIGLINPFRYRGYYYDSETKLYYLNSRYYNPEWLRFINQDNLICANQDLLALNFYAYVSNNPIMFSDPLGHNIFKETQKKVKKSFKAVGKALEGAGKTVVKELKSAAIIVGNTLVNTVTTIGNALGNAVVTIGNGLGSIISGSIIGGSSSTTKNITDHQLDMGLIRVSSGGTSTTQSNNKNYLVKGSVDHSRSGANVSLAVLGSLNISGNIDGDSLDVSAGVPFVFNTTLNGTVGIDDWYIYI